MKIVTERDRIREVSTAWDEQYRNTKDEDKIIIGNKLRTLNLSRVSARTIEAIIGNTSWTDIECHECEATVKEAVEFARFNTSMTICFSCLKKAGKVQP